jgi:hypothetical protein
MDFFGFMRGKTPSPYGKSPTPTPKSRTVTPFHSAKASPSIRLASRRVPMERSPHSAKASPAMKRKRCPNGSRKNKKGNCVKRGSRCPDGSRKNRKTRKCEPKKH